MITPGGETPDRRNLEYGNLMSINELPGAVVARIRAADRHQQIRRRIARTLGVWYVRDCRTHHDVQSSRDTAARLTREWRAVAQGMGLRPSAVRRCVLTAQ